MLGIVLCAALLALACAAYYFFNPFYAPYATLKVKTSGIENPSSDDFVDRYLNKYGSESLDAIEEKINAWRIRQEKKASRMPFWEHRQKQLKSAMREKPFVVVMEDGKAQHRQQYSYEELRERLENQHESHQYALGNAKVAFKTSF